jgi:hypothetical protein
MTDIEESDSQGAIGASWRGENRVQIAHIPSRVCKPRGNLSLTGNKSMDTRTGGGILVQVDLRCSRAKVQPGNPGLTLQAFVI